MKNTIDENNLLNLPRVGDIIQGKIISKEKSAVFLDLNNFKTGIIYGAEYQDAREKLKDFKVGDVVFTKVIELENEDGYVELSINKAGQELTWEDLKQKKDKEEVLNVKIQKVNKGGLLTEISGIPAFLPTSQLSSENYPRVKDGDSSEILKELQKFIGQELEVKIFDLSQREEKIILSEKVKEAKRNKEILENYKAGDVVEGEITAVLDFGAFVKFQKKDIEPLEGLIHISELDWQLVEDPSDIVKVGEEVEAKIIDISDEKAFLSLKALKKNPWADIEKKYKKGDVVKGKVVKFNPFGVFVQIPQKDSSTIQGLVHISEIGSKAEMTDNFEIDKEYDFEILAIDKEKHRMSLKVNK